ncbi:amino acid transporter [Pullulanibacillus pueri]|uniref:ABC transporter permease n=1 Tax=Pullulanibacillus pueri TaxID=1437324 RepID=A0A8J2ZRJ9_9BACL|nr:APC family permease [Pullulanibacillus pueri]MBM7679923.1 amino acid transporter [Pullulanibacillus pueri]GGH73513.1 ABC transporter permease [Pullulanibacillus pueri]
MNKMRRDIGTFALMMTGIGSIIGSGWLFGAWKAAKIAGPSAILSWAIGTIIILIIGLTFTELGSMFPEAGGMVRYGHYTHGSLVGFLAGWANWIAIVSVIPVEAEASAQYMSSWRFDWAHQLYDGKELTTPGLWIAAALVVVYFILNYFTVKLFARVNTAITIFKFIIPALAIIGLIIASFHGSHFTSHETGGFMPYGWSGVFTAIATSGIVFAFNGFQSPINMAGEARDPKRSIPIAVIGSILIAGVIYVLLQITFIGSVKPEMIAHGWNHINLNSPFADLAIAWGLNWLVLLLFADAFVSPSGTGMTYTATTARMIYGMEQNGYFPKVFGRVHPKLGIPRPAMWLNLVVSFIFLYLFRGWGSLSDVISVATVISYLIGPISVVVLRNIGNDLQRPLRLKGIKILAPIAFIVGSLMLYWSRWPLTGEITIVMLIGLPIYFYYQFKNKFRGFSTHLKAGLWMIIYLLWMVVLSLIGSSDFGGLNIIPTGWDTVAVVISALIFYLWGVKSGWKTPEIEGKEREDHQQEER